MAAGEKHISRLYFFGGTSRVPNFMQISDCWKSTIFGFQVAFDSGYPMLSYGVPNSVPPTGEMPDDAFDS